MQFMHAYSRFFLKTIFLKVWIEELIVSKRVGRWNLLCVLSSFTALVINVKTVYRYRFHNDEQEFVPRERLHFSGRRCLPEFLKKPKSEHHPFIYLFMGIQRQMRDACPKMLSALWRRQICFLQLSGHASSYVCLPGLWVSEGE